MTSSSCWRHLVWYPWARYVSNCLVNWQEPNCIKLTITKKYKLSVPYLTSNSKVIWFSSCCTSSWLNGMNIYICWMLCPGIKCLHSGFAWTFCKNIVWVCQRNAQTRNKTQSGLRFSPWTTILYMGGFTTFSCK